MKTAESYLTRGEGNYRNCTDYDDAVKAIKLAQIKAVAKRDEEIRKWAKSFKYNDPIWVEMVARNETLDELITFLSTTTVQTVYLTSAELSSSVQIKPTSAEVAQVELTNECYFTPDEKTTSSTICKNCGKEKMLHTIGLGVKVSKVIINPQPKPSIPIREIEELRDLWQDRVNWISEEIPRLTTARLRVYAVTTRESMKGCIEEVNNIIQSKKK